MERLTKTGFPVSTNTFCFCQICGEGAITDICHYRMYLEMDDNDVPEPGNFMVVCRDPACNKFLMITQEVIKKSLGAWVVLVPSC